MPERLPTPRPTIVAGTNFESGTPNTGQLMHTLGGSRLANVFSGTAGGDSNIWVGAGRLDLALMHRSILAAIPAASGLPVVFYDSAAAVSGGPLATSGHKIVGILAPAVTASGTVIYGETRSFGTVFTSGLCATGTSGQAGWSCSFTPVVSG